MKKLAGILFAALMLCMLCVCVFAGNEKETTSENSTAIQTSSASVSTAKNKLIQNNPTLHDETSGGNLPKTDTASSREKPSPPPPPRPSPPPTPSPDPYQWQSSTLSDGALWIVVSILVLTVAAFTTVLLVKEKKKK